MEWFFGFKKFFNKKIALPPNQNDDLVVFFKLKKNMLKINSKAEVLDGYNLVTVHYNKVCDVLQAGDYELDASTMPALLKFCEKKLSRKGVFIPTRVFADIYFINLNKNSNYSFKTPNYVLTKGQQGKVKIRLQGSFKMQVLNVKRFMQSFCDVYSVVKNKNVLKDLSYYVGRVAEKALDKTSFVLSDFLGNKSKIIDIIMQNLSSLEKDLGIKIDNVSIENVIVPRRYKLSKGFLQDSKNANDNSEYLFKLVEDRLNNIKEDMTSVYAGSISEKSSEPNAQECKNSSCNNFSQNQASSEQENQENIFIKNENSNNYDKTDSYEKTDSSFSNFGDQQAPNIIFSDEAFFAKDKTQNKNVTQTENAFNESNVKNDEVKDNGGEEMPAKERKNKKSSSLVTCPCCGAKNFEDVEFCCVCKSKL
ncbi:MAG: hypothetical protein EOM55_01385 [Clostridia bacterium]|nr:hypothetical protein [Clostridia bacterium]